MLDRCVNAAAFALTVAAVVWVMWVVLSRPAPHTQAPFPPLPELKGGRGDPGGGGTVFLTQ